MREPARSSASRSRPRCAGAATSRTPPASATGTPRSAAGWWPRWTTSWPGESAAETDSQSFLGVRACGVGVVLGSRLLWCEAVQGPRYDARVEADEHGADVADDRR